MWKEKKPPHYIPQTMSQTQMRRLLKLKKKRKKKVNTERTKVASLQVHEQPAASTFEMRANNRLNGASRTCSPRPLATPSSRPDQSPARLGCRHRLPPFTKLVCSGVCGCQSSDGRHACKTSLSFYLGGCWWWWEPADLLTVL